MPEALDTYRLLRGVPSVHDFVRFVKTKAIKESTLDEIDLAQRWEAAHAHFQEMTTSEGNVAVSELEPLAAELTATAEEGIQDPGARKSLAFLPYRWCLIDLNRLIVWQHFVNVSFAERLKMLLPSAPSPDQLVRFVVGHGRPSAELSVQRESANTISFFSPSHDLRVLDTVTVDPLSVRGHQPFGRVSGAVVIYIGFGLNVMNAVYANKRVILTNGTHHAYALHALGIRYAPCLVRSVVTDSQFSLLDLPQRRYGLDWYMKTARPPLLSDYFQPALTHDIRVARSGHRLQLDLTFQESWFPMPSDHI